MNGEIRATKSHSPSTFLKKVMKSVGEHGFCIALILSVALFLVGAAAIITVIVMTVQNGKSEALNREVSMFVVLVGAVFVATAPYIWLKLAGCASVLEIFGRGQEDQNLISCENVLVGNEASEASNV